MKVTGPHTGAPPVETEAAKGKAPVDGAQAGGVEKAGAGPTFAETLAAGRAAPPASTRAQAPDALTSDIAADLQAGKLDRQGALERVVERIIDRQLGADAPPALRAQLRDTLRETISNDPMVIEKLRGLE